MGWPNCLRDFVYSMVVAFVASMAPTASAHSAAMPRCTARSSAAVASPTPSIWPAGSFTSLKNTSAALRPSCVR